MKKMVFRGVPIIFGLAILVILCVYGFSYIAISGGLVGVIRSLTPRPILSELLLKPSGKNSR